MAADYALLITAIVSGFTAFWTYIQEGRINKMCAACPYRQQTEQKNIEIAEEK